MNNTIIIVGGGNIGRRHLQAASKVTDINNIFVYDNNPATISEIVKLIQADGMDSKRIKCVDSMSQLPAEAYLAIIATDSRHRKDAFFELLRNTQVSYCVFEKVLFNKKEDFDNVTMFLDSNGKIKAYVNCARRYTPGYKKLKKMLEGKNFSFFLEGGGWGLGCNAVHFLDLVAFLGGTNDMALDVSLLDEQIIDSKRKNYKEITGRITGRMGNCSFFSIECMNNNEKAIRIIINADKKTYIIDEKNDLFFEIDLDNRDFVSEQEKLGGLLTSVSTSLVINDLLKRGNCNLPDYNEACKIEKLFIERLQPFFTERGFKDECPIT